MPAVVCAPGTFLELGNWIQFSITDDQSTISTDRIAESEPWLAWLLTEAEFRFISVETLLQEGPSMMQLFAIFCRGSSMCCWYIFRAWELNWIFDQSTISTNRIAEYEPWLAWLLTEAEFRFISVDTLLQGGLSMIWFFVTYTVVWRSYRS